MPDAPQPKIACPDTLGTVPGMRFALISFAVILASIAIHELAHLIAARAVGIRALAFFVGFGPKVFSFVRNGVEYGLRIIPLGGYVKIPRMDLAAKDAAQDDDPATDDAADGGLRLLEPASPDGATGSPGISYASASLPRQLLVAVAGPLSHAVIAFALVFGAFAFADPDLFDGAPGVAYVLPGSEGEAAGFQTADVVLSVDGTSVSSWSEVVDAVLAEGSDDASGEPGAVSQVLLARGTEEVLLDDVPLDAWPTLGVPFENPGKGLSFFELIPAAAEEVWYLTTATFSALGDVFSNLSSAAAAALGHEPPSANRPASLVGVVDTSVDFGAGYGAYGVLLLLAQLNIILGIFNLIPLHPLDGGHAAAALANRTLSGTRLRRPALIGLQYLAYPVLTAFLLLFLVGVSIDLRILGQDPLFWLAALAGLGLGVFLFSRVRSHGEPDPTT